MGNALRCAVCLRCSLSLRCATLAQERQTSFAIQSLLFLYDRALEQLRQPRIVVVGHSMGGVVARAALARLSRCPGFGGMLVHQS
jgi:pimeloyl-ACP methyl ester carboxylesterase